MVWHQKLVIEAKVFHIIQKIILWCWFSISRVSLCKAKSFFTWVSNHGCNDDCNRRLEWQSLHTNKKTLHGRQFEFLILRKICDVFLCTWQSNTHTWLGLRKRTQKACGVSAEVKTCFRGHAQHTIDSHCDLSESWVEKVYGPRFEKRYLRNVTLVCLHTENKLD